MLRKESVMKRVCALLLMLLCLCVASAACAAANYPNRPIRFIAPFVAGGPSDLLSRLLGQKLNEAWGQPIVVDNRGSAGGIVGFEIAAKAPPDGYTLLLATSGAITINPNVYLKLPYDPVRDYQPITQVTSGAYLLAVHPGVPAKTLPEFIAHAKAKPSAVNYATTGTNNLLAMELLNYMAAIKTVAISYKGTGQAVNALLGGEVQTFVISPLVGLPHINAGKLRALGVTGLKRGKTLPDVPAIAETLPGYEQIVWHSVMAPAKTPRPITEKLTRELIRIVKQPDMQERFSSQGLDAVGSTPEEIAALIKSETALYARLVKQIGLQPQ
jgi:tripartite-type tricarboxylate transporter receptor subunit TctC